jgi:hypothetical protein
MQALLASGGHEYKMLAATWGFVSRILAPLIYSEVLVASDSAELMLAAINNVRKSALRFFPAPIPQWNRIWQA